MEVRKSLILPFNAKRQIFVQDRDGHKPPPWGYFGGSIEEGETPLEAVIRETSEELSLSLTESDLVYLGESLSKWGDVTINRYVYLYPTEQEVFDVREGKGGEWLSFDEIRERFDQRDMFDEVVKLVEQAGY